MDKQKLKNKRMNTLLEQLLENHRISLKIHQDMGESLDRLKEYFRRLEICLDNMSSYINCM